ncbi:hypothetical protein J4Q44_G00292470 [Coregonus suidteri]|uniref:Uncharacterized protein n=1 Tax=Coregonus suidteri TaxID=861788 RepID=A0AAN8KU62_9TELE
MKLCNRGALMLVTTAVAFIAFSLMTIAVGTDYWLYSRGVCRSKTSLRDNETIRKNEVVMTHSGLWRTCCLEGIRTNLLDSEEHTCFTCKQSDVSPDALIANKFLRQAVNNFKNESGYTKQPRNKTLLQSAPPPARPQPFRTLGSRQQDPLLANARQQDPLLANARQQDPLLANARQQDPLLANARQQDPLLANARQQDPLLANARQQDPLLANARQQDPLLVNTSRPPVSLTPPSVTLTQAPPIQTPPIGPPEVSITPDPAPEPHRAEPQHLANQNEPPPPGEMEAGPYMMSEPPIRSADSGPQGYHMPLIGHPPPHKALPPIRSTSAALPFPQRRTQTTLGQTLQTSF